MTLQVTLADFQIASNQCAALVADAHQTDHTGIPRFPVPSQKQITTAAFLNLFIAWESFLEDAILKLMTGLPTISGQAPLRYVNPLTTDSARDIMVGTTRFFDFGNIDHVKKIVVLYFHNGAPFEPYLSAASPDITDIRTVRNASAHITTSTQRQLETLAQRLLSTPKPGIDVYQLLIASDPKAPGSTIFATYQNKLLTVAHLIANG